ncbi:hypothetical protein AMECASPLE_035649 [Ameca splendens]|uniref:Uncharacterized protein n=1 Tax=Ameca splendens TaxID=208324 RepID=A0ABV0Y7A3_9TELE
MQEWCYNYLVTRKLQTHGVYDRVIDITNNEILDCGYTGPINTDHKNTILRAITLHVTTKRTPMLQQLREGLGVYNFINVMERKPDEFRSLFVVGKDDKVDSNYILSHIAPELSPQGSTKQAKETKILEYFQDFLYKLEDTQPAV